MTRGDSHDGLCKDGVRDDILERLRCRDWREKRPWEDIIKSRTRLLQECQQRERTQEKLAQQMSIQTEELRALRESSGMEGGGGRCQKCSEMHNELTRNLREKAEDKQEILRLEKKVQEVQAQLVKTEANAHQAHQAASDKDQQIKEKTLKIAALDANLQVLMQECASRTIEIDQLRPKLRDLHAENQQLISQLLAFKESMADRYNEINAMQEEAVRIKRSAELMAAASCVPTASPHTPCDAGGENALLSKRMSSSGLTFGCNLPEAPRQTLVAHERSEIHALAHNCSGAMVLTGSDDRSIKLWDSRNGTRLAALEGAVKGVMCVAFSCLCCFFSRFLTRFTCCWPFLTRFTCC